jgi:hypothetical protein
MTTTTTPIGSINFEQAINGLDLQLFEKIRSQTTDDDKRSLLACELAARELRPEYNFLEIGSYLGGSIQPHLLDPKCGHIYSIDKRPEAQPDARGYCWRYQNNSTARMLELLQSVSVNTQKITTLDGSTRTIDPSLITDKVHLCFIDGEHTDEAVSSDFEFCLKALDDNGAILFHDAHIIYNGIARCIKRLEETKRKFRAYVLPHIIFVIEIGDFPLHRNPLIAESLKDNHRSYLHALQKNDAYRTFANRFPFGPLRRLKYKFTRGNVSY